MFSLWEHDHSDVALQIPSSLRRGGIPLALLPRSSSSGRRTTSAQGQGDLRITVRASPRRVRLRGPLTPRAHRTVWGSPDEYAGSSDRAGPSISFGAPADDRLSITASGDELGSGEDDSAALPPSGRVALPESDPELTAMLSRAAESIGLHYRRPPSPERSRLDDWFLRGAGRTLATAPGFRSSRKCMRRWLGSWKAPFSARSRPSGLLRPHHPRTAERPRGIGGPPSRARHCHAALPAGRLPPGGVIRAFRPGL